jgi:hypothetical protein
VWFREVVIEGEKSETKGQEEMRTFLVKTGRQRGELGVKEEQLRKYLELLERDSKMDKKAFDQLKEASKNI